MPDSAVLPLLIITGLCVGSFLNVCIYRLPRNASVATPASHCTICNRSLRWFENVPLLSYIALRGRCRTCRTAISIVYPLVEVATAAIFVLYYVQFGWTALLVPRLLFACAMIVLFVIDLKHRILPNVITLPGIVIGFAFSLFLEPGWVDSAIGILIGGGVLLAIAEAYYRLRHEEGLGMGDVKMLGMIGAFLGWKLTVLTLVASSAIGSIVGVALIVLKKGDLKYALPFGTFLAAAAVVVGIVGNDLLVWYLSFY